MELVAILNRLLPGGTANSRDASNFEVNGLEKDTQPQNCEVLCRGMEPDSRGDRREHFLVQIDGVMLFFRICTAMENSGYAEFAVGRGIAILAEEQTKLEAYARDWIAVICKPA